MDRLKSNNTTHRISVLVLVVSTLLPLTSCKSPLLDTIEAIRQQAAQAAAARAVMVLEYMDTGLEIPSGTPIAFGNDLAYRESRSIDLAIRNKGEKELLLTGSPRVALSGGSVSSYVISGALPDRIAPGGVATFRISCSGTVKGSLASSLAIPTNDPEVGTYSTSLTAAMPRYGITRLTDNNYNTTWSHLCRVDEDTLAILYPESDTTNNRRYYLLFTDLHGNEKKRIFIRDFLPGNISMSLVKGATSLLVTILNQTGSATAHSYAIYDLEGNQLKALASLATVPEYGLWGPYWTGTHYVYTWEDDTDEDLRLGRLFVNEDGVVSSTQYLIPGEEVQPLKIQYDDVTETFFLLYLVSDYTDPGDGTFVSDERLFLAPINGVWTVLGTPILVHHLSYNETSDPTGSLRDPRLVIDGSYRYVVWRQERYYTTGLNQNAIYASVDTGLGFGTPVELAPYSDMYTYLSDIIKLGTSWHIHYLRSSLGVSARTFYLRSFSPGLTSLGAPIKLEAHENRTIYSQNLISGGASNCFLGTFNSLVEGDRELFFVSLEPDGSLR